MEHIGMQTIKFKNPPTILETASIVGPKESQGPLAKYFDQCIEDEFWGEKSWEKAESHMLRQCFSLACDKAKIPPSALVSIVTPGFSVTGT